MAKSSSSSSDSFAKTSYLSGLGKQSEDWQSRLAAVAARFNQEFQGQPFDLPPEVEAMPIFRERSAGTLQAKITSPFWELAKPKKNDRCLDLGCGVSFLIYPWCDWGALFHGQEISTIARDILKTRGPQLNSKLFKGVELAPAHELAYEANVFDIVIATGVSCYYPLAYWQEVLTAVKRVLKPGGVFVFDALDPETPLAENWAILETYLGTEVFLEPLSAWDGLIKQAGGRIVKRLPGELFQLYKVSF